MRILTCSTTCTLPLLLLAVACGPDAGVIAPDVGAGIELSVAAECYSEWTTPVNLGRPVNSEFIENAPEMSKDGLSLYFGSNRPGGQGSQDVWVSRRASVDDPWGIPVNAGPAINTPGVEAGPNLSRDGHELYFTSNRPGGFGSQDLWVSRRAHTDDDLAWDEPVNLGPEVNGPLFEAGPGMRRPELYFARGPGVGATGAPSDIYVSRMRGDGFDQAEVVEELSMPAPVHDSRPSIRFDGREIFIASTRPGGLGGDDIYASVREGNGHRWETPVNQSAVNTSFREVQAAISEDGTVLFFASDRPGGSGNLDLWVTTRAKGECPKE